MEKQLTERDIERGYWLDIIEVVEDFENLEAFIRGHKVHQVRMNESENFLEKCAGWEFEVGSWRVDKGYAAVDMEKLNTGEAELNTLIQNVKVPSIYYSMELENEKTNERFVVRLPDILTPGVIFKKHFIEKKEQLKITDEQKTRLLDIYGAAYDFELDVDGRAMDLVESTLETLGIDTKFLEELDTEWALEK